MQSIGLFAGLLMLVVGLTSLYFGLTGPSGFVLFGVDSLLVIGGLQIVAGLFFLADAYAFRPRIPPRQSD